MAFQMVAESPMNFSAHYYALEDFTGAKHTHELLHRPDVYLNLDYEMVGLGSASVVPVTLPEYHVSVDEHSLWFVLKPIV